MKPQLQLINTALAVVIVLSTASGALAATKQKTAAPSNDVYDARGNYVGGDPDSNIRFDLQRDGGERGRN
jgi:hypothetical protein